LKQAEQQERILRFSENEMTWRLSEEEDEKKQVNIFMLLSV